MQGPHVPSDLSDLFPQHYHCLCQLACFTAPRRCLLEVSGPSDILSPLPCSTLSITLGGLLISPPTKLFPTQGCSSSVLLPFEARWVFAAGCFPVYYWIFRRKLCPLPTWPVSPPTYLWQPKGSPDITRYFLGPKSSPIETNALSPLSALLPKADLMLTAFLDLILPMHLNCMDHVSYQPLFPTKPDTKMVPLILIFLGLFPCSRRGKMLNEY